MNIIAVFSNRTHTLAFQQFLMSAGIYCAVISTPKSTNLPCGICVKFPESSLILAKKVAPKYTSFTGFYTYDYNSKNYKKLSRN